MSAVARAFVVVSLILGIGCAQKNGDEGGQSYCASLPTSPSCSTSAPPVSAGQHLTLPTEYTRFENETDPSIPFPTEFQIVSLTPGAGTMVTAPFPFAYTFKARMEKMANQFEATNFEFFPSDDGVNPSGPAFNNGSVRSDSEALIQQNNGTGTVGMNVTFKYILVKAKWLRSGVGYYYSQLSYQVDLGK